MKKKSNFKKLLGVLVFFGLAAISIWAVTEQSETFSLDSFWESAKTINPLMLGLALCGTVMFVVFEGLGIRTMVVESGEKCSYRKGMVYAATDIYFSAITPSAIGGQPASAYFMMQDGISGGVCAVALLCGLMMYSISIVVIGVICIIVCPDVIMKFSLPSRILILIGAIAQVVLVILFYMLLRHSSILHKTGNFFLDLMKKLHLTKHYEERREKLDRNIDTYSRECKYLKERPKLLAKMLFFNIGQRLSLMLVTVFCFIGFTKRYDLIMEVLAIQCLVTVGSNCVPIPGAMGVYDLLLVDGFTVLVPEFMAVNMELVSRSLSFYVCLIGCGIIVLMKYFFLMLREHREGDKEAVAVSDGRENYVGEEES